SQSSSASASFKGDVPVFNPLEVTMKKIIPLAAASLALAMLLAGCASAPTTPRAQRSLHDDAKASLAAMEAHDPNLTSMLNRAYAYAIFPSVGKGGLIVGGAAGRGEVYRQEQLIGYSELQQATVGAQAGGQEFHELIVFQDPGALDRFMRENFSFL